MLTIRFTRTGKKNQPFFKIIVIDKRRSAKGGRVVEFLGFFDPLTKRKSLKKERVLYWIKNGAKPSDTVHNLLVKEKIIKAKKINLSKKPKQDPKEVAFATEVKSPEVAPQSDKVEEKKKITELVPAPTENSVQQ